MNTPRKYVSKDFDDCNFRAHGHYEILCVDGVFTVSVIGPLNLECIQALGKARAKAFTECRNDVPKLGIAEFRDSMLMSLEALEAYTAGLKNDLKNSGQWKALAWVAAPDVEGRSIMTYQFSKIFETHQVPWKIFEDMDAATNWMAGFRTATTKC